MFGPSKVRAYASSDLLGSLLKGGGDPERSAGFLRLTPTALFFASLYGRPYGLMLLNREPTFSSPVGNLRPPPLSPI